MSVKIPAPFKTDAEKIVWLGNEIRSALLTIEEANEMKAKAKEDIKSYEATIKEVLKKGSER